MKISLPHSAGVDAPAVVNPICFSETGISYGHAAPILGEHTETVLGNIGLTAERIAALRDKGMV